MIAVSYQPRWRRPGIVQSSIYLPTAMHDALREAAFKERRKMRDIMLEGIQLALDTISVMGSLRFASRSTCSAAL